MDNVSPKMKKTIKNIELGLGIKFTGKTFDEASEFIGAHLEELKKVDLRTKLPPSAKMKNGIKMCEDALGVKFTGTSMKEASEFLDKYMQKTLDLFNERRSKNAKRHSSGRHKSNVGDINRY